MGFMAGHPQTEQARSRKHMAVPFVINCNTDVTKITAAPEGFANLGAAVEIVCGIAAGAAATATGPLTGFAYTALSSDTAAVVIGIGLIDPLATRPICAWGHVLSDTDSLPHGYEGDGGEVPTRFACVDVTAATSGSVAPDYTTVAKGAVAFALTFASTAVLTGATAAMHCIAHLEWE